MTSTDSTDIRRISLPDKEVVLIGTAHISQESVSAVQKLIEEEHPDAVCVELDEQRYQVLRNEQQWQNLNLFQVIRKGQAPFLMANLVLSSFQKRMGLQTGVKPGAELAAAAAKAEQIGCRLVLADRNLRTTLLRTWRGTGFWKRMRLMTELIVSLFYHEPIDEEELARIRQTDALSVLLEEMASVLPSVKTILVDERDIFMADQIRRAPGSRVVAVVGAAHVPGITHQLPQAAAAEVLTEINRVPPKALVSRLIPWTIPLLVVGLFVAGFFFGGREEVANAAVAWILANGLLSALGAILALGHPLTIASAFVAAPITSLNPTIGAGFVTGMVQTVLVPPRVGDMERVGEDLTKVSGWWKNRVSRVLLVFVFSSLGSVAGTLVAFHWLKDLW